MRLVPSPSQSSPARRVRGLVLAALAICGLAAPVSAQSVSLTTIGAPYTQNFDTLSNTALSTTNPLTITGWSLAESGTSTRNNGQYAVDTGSSNTGDAYSYGAAGDAERAFGSLRSGTLVPVYGVAFTNNTGATITSLRVGYTGEQWRIGNTLAAREDRLDFQYSLDASSLATGTWQDADTLDFINPIQTATLVGALNGNSAQNRRALDATISGLSIPNGATFWVRWNDADGTGADDGMAVDDFSLTPLGGSGPVTPTLSVNDVSLAEGNSGTTTFTFTVNLSAPAPTGGVTFDIATADNTATTANGDYTARALTGQTIPAGSSSYTFAVAVLGDTAVEPNETFFVNVTNLIGANAGDMQGQGTIQNDDVGLTAIHAIQGSGSTSSLVGQVVTTRGIVTALRSNGFYIQMPDAQIDADPMTSEGILVFTSSTPPAAAAVGNLVQVTGTVTEFVSSTTPTYPKLTEITSPITVQLGTGNALPTAVVLGPTDFTTLDSLERYEGMRVTVPSLTVTHATDGNVSEFNATSTSNGIFYAVLTGTARPFREAGLEPFAVTPAGTPANVPRFDGNPERLRVDSDAIAGNPAINVATGAVVSGLTGPLDFAGGWYTLLPTNSASAGVSGGLGIVSVPNPAAGESTVGAINLERFFDTVNDPLTSDPVLTVAAFDRRLAKASATVRLVLKSPDILAVVELEDLATLQALADRINDDTIAAGTASPGYQAYLVEGNDVGGIDVGFLVKSAVQVVAVTQLGASATYVNPNNGVSELLNDRPPLVLQAVITPTGGTALPLTVIVNHLRSLNGIDDEGTDGTGTSGGRVRAKRRAQAEFLATLVQQRQVANPNERILLVGDFNAFEVNDGYVDVIGTIAGTPTPGDQVVLASPDLVNPDLIDLVRWVPPAERYSYAFEGNAQVLDHALITQNLSRLVSRITFARSNVDQPETRRNDTSAARVSDHDGVVIGLATGTPKLSVTVTGVADGGSLVTLRFRNTGAGNLFNLVIDSLRTRVTSGTGTATPTTGVPLAVAPVLGPGQSVTVTVAVTSSPSVLKYALGEGGSYQTASGATLRFSSTQSVTK
jgi:predicted extracellular nuclease